MLVLSLAGARRASSRVPKLSMLTSAEASAVADAAAARLSEPLVMPPRLSPTAAATFRDCPQLYLFRNLWRLPEPPSKVRAVCAREPRSRDSRSGARNDL